MKDVLVFDGSLERIAPHVAELGDLRLLGWSTERGLTEQGRPIDAGSVRPEIGWIGFDVLGAGRLKDYGHALLGFDSLSWVQTGMAGLDHPLYAALARAGVRITKSSAQSIPIAEYVLAHALAHFHDLEARRAAQAAKEWRHMRFRELMGSRWVIAGFGHIGRGVALRARAFGCHVTTLRRSGKRDEMADAVVTRAELPSALGRADVLVLACPETPETSGMVDAALLGAMKPGGLLINVARGGLVVEDDLLAGLERERPAAAVLDVFASEPLPSEHPFWVHPRVTVTAHMSNAGSGTHRRGDEAFIDNLRRYVEGAPLVDEVPATELTGGDE